MRTETGIAAIRFDPALPDWALISLACLSVVLLGFALWRRARGVVWRAAAVALLLGWLLNPRLVQETRETLPDVAVLVTDESASMRVGSRAAAAAAARAAIEQRIGRMDQIELRSVVAPEAGTAGTALFAALDRALADVPRARLAGVILLTDGQAHDRPAAPPVDAPIHALLTARAEENDRRVRVIESPGFGIVGRTVEVRVAVDDLLAPGAPAAGTVRLSVRRDGGAPAVQSVPIGREHRIPVAIERGGPTVLDIAAETRPDEASPLNNRAVVTINGVRDRLRVLLVSGEPHAGERTWRRLLKSDPSVDLVHFTILRPPEKDDLTPLNELALIAFPVRELFQQRIRDFDLIILDRFQNRGILPPAYLRNIADYVRAGGALLINVGPDFVGPASLAATPLGAVIPARPAGIAEARFRPLVSEVGARHPITANLPGWRAEGEPSWGPWYRRVNAASVRGQVLMTGPHAAPLMVAERVEQGRVALLLSDHIWLWSRNHEGGGPQAELLRRIAHWLMREPELEEEDLVARVEQGRLLAERRTLEGGPPPEFTVTAPDGTTQRIAPDAAGSGRARISLAAEAPGVWAVTDGRRTAYAAAGAANPVELADLRATAERLAPLARATGGGVVWLDPAGAPELRRTELDRSQHGPGWIGLRRNRDHLVTGVAALPLLPTGLALPLLLGAIVLAWRKEGR